MYLIGKKLASTTVAKRLQFARSFFRAAKRQRLIRENPFAEVSAKAATREDRKHFVARENIDQLLPLYDPIWRTIVGLARYGGLRCPSEVLSLRWQDVDWEAERVIVQSPKTEHHEGKGSRPIPMFAELRPYLEEAFELVPEGAVYVVGGNYRQAAQSAKGWSNCNMRTQFERLVKRAGLTPWPRLFHALRSSRETELLADFPMHVVTAWLGNTPKIALKHYAMATPAAPRSGAKSGAPTPENGAPTGAHPRAARSTHDAATPYVATTTVPHRPRTGTHEDGEDRIRTCGGV